ncbi:hypothetical protein B0H19DRAFT_1066450 [Mycena capillaripes]|nr:hypothetical protein B0H19DRAFT_1066450 [Mycena capillaripes]
MINSQSGTPRMNDATEGCFMGISEKPSTAVEGNKEILRGSKGDKGLDDVDPSFLGPNRKDGETREGGQPNENQKICSRMQSTWKKLFDLEEVCGYEMSGDATEIQETMPGRETLSLAQRKGTRERGRNQGHTSARMKDIPSMKNRDRTPVGCVRSKAQIGRSTDLW